MKKLLRCLTITVLLCGCGKQDAVPPVQDSVREEHMPEDISCREIVLEDENYTLTFMIPADALTKEEQNESSGHTLTVFKDENELAVIGIMYGFGVCGTGLKEEKTVFRDNSVILGYYDDQPDWSFAVYTDFSSPGIYVLNHSGEDASADMILESMRVEPAS